MEPVAIATLTNSVVSLLVSYFKKSGEAFAAEGGKAAWAAATKLYATVGTMMPRQECCPLKSLKAAPEDPKVQTALRTELDNLATDKPEFAQQLAALLKESDEAGADGVFQTTIHGAVEKLIQIGVVHGIVNISG